MDDVTSWGATAPDTRGEHAGHARRDFLKKVGIGATAAWTAPILLSTTAAQAQGTVPGITFVGGNSNSVPQGTNTVPVTNPGASGNRLLALVSVNPSATVATPAGWTLVDEQSTGNNDVHSYVFTRVADGSLSSSFARTTSGGQPAGVMRATIVAYSGVASVGPDLGAVENNPLATHNFPGVTTTGANLQMIVKLGSLGDVLTSTWGAPPGGQSLRLDTGAGQRAHLAFDSVQSTPGGTGNVAVNTAVSYRSSQHTIALVPS